MLVSGCALAATLLTLHVLAGFEPLGTALRALVSPRPAELRDLLVHDGALPRILTAWVAGAGLAVSASLLQVALRNPLAGPTTLGISSGAGLAMALGLLLVPGLTAADPALIALAGALAACVAVLMLSRRQQLSPEAVSVTGLLVTLGCGAGTTCLALLKGQQLGAFAIWGGGSLDQQGWPALVQMALHALPALAFAFLLVRPLDLLRLDDSGVRSLGVSPLLVRGLVMLTATWLAAAIVGTVGNIGFVDLAAAACVRLAGARRLLPQMAWSAFAGAAMLWLADGLALSIGRAGLMPIPTGAMTAIAGAPLLILLASRSRANVPPRALPPIATPRRRRPHRAAVVMAVALVAMIVLGLCLGHGPHGWRWSSGGELDALLPWRAPRVFAALSAGLCLALAGVLVQSVMGNPMASPELLGVGPAACIAGVVFMLVVPGADRSMQVLAGGAGAAAALAILLLLLRYGDISPVRSVLLGIGLTALLSAALNLGVALAPLSLEAVLTWIGGSTYHVTPGDAKVTAVIAAVGLVACLATTRLLALLPLGAPSATSLGVSVRQANTIVLLLAAVLSAAGTLMVGPFAFIGAMAPQIARMAGARSPMAVLILSALAGGLVLVIADFLGRNLMFPYQLPAGTMASVIGMLVVGALTVSPWPRAQSLR